MVAASVRRRRTTPAWTRWPAALKNWSDSRTRQTGRAAGRVSAVQVPPPRHAERAVHHRRDPGRAGPHARGAAAAGPAEDCTSPPASWPGALDAGTARIMSATVRRDGGRWHVSFCVEVDRADRRPARPDAVVGVDVGIKHLAVLSTGEIVPNPRHLDAAQRQLRAPGPVAVAQVGPDRRTGRRPVEAVAARRRKRLGRAHARVANLRRDGLHKLTTRLAREHGTIVVEDLNVTGMLAQPAAGPAHRRRRLRRDPPATGLQDRVERRPAARRRPLVSVLEDLLRLRRGENQTRPVRARIRLPVVRPDPRPGPQRRTQPRRPRGGRSPPPGVARWQDVEPTVRPATAGRWL